ncbi:MAG: hypothetical protein ABI686_13330 [Acidobacteriota bacterium]
MNKHLKKQHNFVALSYRFKIGAGEMGEVFLAEDNKIDKKVTFKILDENFAKHESNLRCRKLLLI